MLLRLFVTSMLFMAFMIALIGFAIFIQLHLNLYDSIFLFTYSAIFASFSAWLIFKR